MLKSRPGWRSRLAVAGVGAVFALVAFLVAPFALGDRVTLVPEGQDLDAIQQVLLVSSGADALLEHPAHLYDTAILYPDHTQIRSTEPFTGFALAALPLREIFRLNDVDVFEVLRWLCVFVSLIYAYLLIATCGADRTWATAGAILCICQPSLMFGIERLQVVDGPLLLGALYHAVMVLRGGMRTDLASGSANCAAHATGLFATVALYPLVGAINAVIASLAVVIILPWLLAATFALPLRVATTSLVVPVLLAGVVDALVLAPWIFGRGDMAAYVDDAFLRIKHWNTTKVPLSLGSIPQFVDERLGFGLTACLALVVVAALISRSRWPESIEENREPGPPSLWPVWVLSALAAFLLWVAALGVRRQTAPWLGVVYDAVFLAALVFSWREQIRARLLSGSAVTARALMVIAASLGVFLCLLSCGPVYTSNDHPLASGMLRALLFGMPPIASIREFDRIWMFGAMFLSLFVAIRIGAMSGSTWARLRPALTVVTTGLVLWPLMHRPLVASEEVRPPAEVLRLARRSRAAGAIYVHPQMNWNSRDGVWMIAVAKALGRPIVNGYLGVPPLWFDHARNVLHRFPDAETLWLLRQWKVNTVLAIDSRGAALEVDGCASSFENERHEVVWDCNATAEPHPSVSGRAESAEGLAATLNPIAANPNAVEVTWPAGRLVTSVEFQFPPSAVSTVPEAIDVFRGTATNSARLNLGRSGEWIQSLTADALVHRRIPTAVVRLTQPVRPPIRVEWRGLATLPVARLVVYE